MTQCTYKYPKSHKNAGLRCGCNAMQNSTRCQHHGGKDIKYAKKVRKVTKTKSNGKSSRLSASTYYNNSGKVGDVCNVRPGQLKVLKLSAGKVPYWANNTDNQPHKCQQHGAGGFSLNPLNWFSNNDDEGTVHLNGDELEAISPQGHKAQQGSAQLGQPQRGVQLGISQQSTKAQQQNLQLGKQTALIPGLQIHGGLSTDQLERVLMGGNHQQRQRPQQQTNQQQVLGGLAQEDPLVTGSQL